MTSVFLSYDRDDAPKAQAVAHVLERAGHSVWWDRHIKGGTQYSKEIEGALNAAEAVVVLWSKDSVASAWVRDEAAVGRDRGRLVPVSIDGTPPPIGFRQYQTIDLSDWRGLPTEPTLSDLIGAVDYVARGEGTNPSLQLAQVQAKNFQSTRRVVAGGLLAAATAGTAGFLFLQNRRPRISPEVEALMEQGWTAQMQGGRDGHSQGIALFRRVVAIAPNYADGWAALALAYRDAAQFRPRAENVELRERARLAGKRATEIDPENGLGLAMVAASIPHRGGLFQIERGLRQALQSDPGNEFLMLVLGLILNRGGRNNDAVRVLEEIRTRPLLPIQYWNQIHAFWGANRIEEVDRLVAEAAEIYPTQRSIWFIRLNYWLFGGKPSQAAAMATDRDSRPTGFSDAEANVYVDTAEAIDLRLPAAVNRIMSLWMARAREGSGYAELAIQIACALERADEAFTLAAAYFFSSGFTVPDLSFPGGSSYRTLNERETSFLFQPPARIMRSDRRFDRLVSKLGLDQYWKESGVQPDYRRG